MTEEKKPSNVKALFKGIEIPEDKPLEPSQYVIDYLERRVEEAKKGELRSILAVCEYEDKPCAISIVGDVIDVPELFQSADLMVDYFREGFSKPYHAAGLGIEPEYFD